MHAEHGPRFQSQDLVLFFYYFSVEHRAYIIGTRSREMGTAWLLIVFRSRKEKIVKVPMGRMPRGLPFKSSHEADELSQSSL